MINKSNFNPKKLFMNDFCICPKNIVNYIFLDKVHFDLFMNMIETIYETLLCDLYMNLEVIKYIRKK